MERINHEGLTNLRIAIGRQHDVTPEIEKVGIPVVLGEEEAHFLGLLASEEEMLSPKSDEPSKLIVPAKSKLLSLSNGIHNVANKWVSHASLAAALVSEEFHHGLLVKAQEYADFRNYPFFVLAYDMAHGSSLVIASVHFGTDGVAMGHQRFMEQMLRAQGNAAMHRQSKVYRIMDQEQIAKEALVNSDESCFTLIDEAVKFAQGLPSKINKQPNRGGFFSDKYVGLGGESAGKMFKAAYSVAQLIPSPNQ